MSPLVVLSWDLEAVGDAGKFPDATKPDNVVCQVGMVVRRVGKGSVVGGRGALPNRRLLLSLGPCDLDGGAVCVGS